MTQESNGNENILSRRIKHWLPAIGVAILISIFSTHYFTSEQTARVILPILRWIFPAATPRLLHLMHVGIRKLAHVTEFGVFSITVFHGVRAGRTGWRLDWALVTLLIAVAYAGIDEWHQSFVPLRQASPRDVAVDALGALLAQSLVWAYANWRWGSANSPKLESRPAKD
jgi:VanZ family protein